MVGMILILDFDFGPDLSLQYCRTSFSLKPSGLRLRRWIFGAESVRVSSLLVDSHHLIHSISPLHHQLLLLDTLLDPPGHYHALPPSGKLVLGPSSSPCKIGAQCVKGPIPILLVGFKVIGFTRSTEGVSLVFSRWDDEDETTSRIGGITAVCSTMQLSIRWPSKGEEVEVVLTSISFRYCRITSRSAPQIWM